MVPKSSRSFHCSLVLFVLTAGCSDNSLEVQKLRNAETSLRGGISGISERTPFARECLLPAYRRGLNIVEQPGIGRIDEPVLLAAVFRFNATDRPGRPEHSIWFMWLESGFKAVGFYIEKEDGEDMGFKPFEWTEDPKKFYAGNALRDIGMGIELDEGGEEDVPGQRKRRVGSTPTIRLNSEVLDCEKMRVGLVLEDGTRLDPIDAYVRSQPGTTDD